MDLRIIEAYVDQESAHVGRGESDIIQAIEQILLSELHIHRNSRKSRSLYIPYDTTDKYPRVVEVIRLDVEVGADVDSVGAKPCVLLLR